MKAIKNIVVIMTIILSLFLASTVHAGYTMYRDVTENHQIQEKINSVRSSEHYVPINQISNTFKEAIIAVEDHRFFEHSGIDLISITRAAYNNFKAGEIVSGGSTITQQLSKNLFLTFDKTYERKIAEVFIAKSLEAMFTKEEILELYVNVICFGENQYGIEAASQHYFLKSANDLSDSESVILAGLPQSPNAYALNHHMEKAVMRSYQVVAAMLATDILDVCDGITLKEEILYLRSMR